MQAHCGGRTEGLGRLPLLRVVPAGALTLLDGAPHSQAGSGGQQAESAPWSPAMVPAPSMLSCAPDRSLPMFQQQPQAKLPAGPLSQGCPGLPFAWILLFPGLAQEAKALSMKRAASSNLPQHILLTTKTSREKGKGGSYSQP